MKVVILADLPELLIKPASLALARERIGLLEADGMLELFVSDADNA